MPPGWRTSSFKIVVKLGYRLLVRRADKKVAAADEIHKRLAVRGDAGGERTERNLRWIAIGAA
jgi:hypothetical protein